MKKKIALHSYLLFPASIDELLDQALSDSSKSRFSAWSWFRFLAVDFLAKVR